MHIPLKHKHMHTQLHFFNSFGHMPIFSSTYDFVSKKLFMNSQLNYYKFKASHLTSTHGETTTFSNFLIAC